MPESGQNGNLTKFQIECKEQIEEMLRANELTVNFSQGGEADRYLYGKVESLRTPLEIYIYEDEVGFFEGREWWICETPDFDSAELMIASFLEQLTGAIRRQSVRGPQSIRTEGAE